MPYCICYDGPAKIKIQFAWDEMTKALVWQKIVKQKIYNQAAVLTSMNKGEAANLLLRYCDEVQPGDSTNREGLAAKSYFAALFGNNFDRRSKSFKVNTYLNYGYSILLSAINRAVSVYGYLSMVGIHHIGKENPFNLSCDIMEPFRPFVDYVILTSELTEQNYKSQMMQMLAMLVVYDDKNMIMDNAVSQYTLDVVKALGKNDVSMIKELTKNG